MPRSSRSTERRAPRRWRFLAARIAIAASERGSASLEFLTVGIILLVPLVYLVLAVAAIQGGALAVEGAARQAARLAVQASAEGAADDAVDRAVRVTLADYGIDAEAASVTIECSATDCVAPGSRIRVSVFARVSLPLVPDFLSLDAVGSVPLEASATQTVSRFARSGS